MDMSRRRGLVLTYKMWHAQEEAYAADDMEWRVVL